MNKIVLLSIFMFSQLIRGFPMDKIYDGLISKGYSDPVITHYVNEKFDNHFKNLEEFENKKIWFIKYKQMVDKYSNIYKTPKTLHDVYDEKEVEIFQRIVEAEVTDGDFISKVNVANVILNRVNSNKFPNTIEGVVFQKKQFSPISDGRYYTVKPTEDTLLAIEYAFLFEDTTDGALYFESGNRFVHMSYAEYLFKDNAGHHFYR